MNRQILGWLLTTEDLYLNLISKLEGLSLQSGDWDICNWVKKFRREKGKLPTWAELKVRYDVIPECKELEKDFVKDEVVDYIREEKLKSWIVGVAEDIEKGFVNYTKVFEDVKRMRDTLDFSEEIGSDVKEVYEEVLENVVNPESNVRIKTGIKGLDNITGGGFGKGEISVLIAPPGIGKTMFLLNCMYAALVNRKNVLLLSCELSEMRLLERLYRRIAKVSREEVRLNKDIVAKELSRFFRFTKAKGIILYKRPYFWKVEDVDLYIDKLRSRGQDIDVLLIDYLDKLDVGRREYRLALRDLTEDLRYLSIEKNIAVITATQANRLSLSSIMITEEHVSESFGKVEVSDVVLSLSRTFKDEGKNMGKLVMLKNRDRGGRGVIIPVRMDLNKCLVEDLA